MSLRIGVPSAIDTLVTRRPSGALAVNSNLSPDTTGNLPAPDSTCETPFSRNAQTVLPVTLVVDTLFPNGKTVYTSPRVTSNVPRSVADFGRRSVLSCGVYVSAGRLARIPPPLRRAKSVLYFLRTISEKSSPIAVSPTR